jgi:hypothetical protein
VEISPSCIGVRVAQTLCRGRGYKRHRNGPRGRR